MHSTLPLPACRTPRRHGTVGQHAMIPALTPHPSRNPPFLPASCFAALAVQGAARQREERLSLLEYELRVAREDLRELRAAQHERGGQQPQGPGPPAGPRGSPARQGAPGTEKVAQHPGVPSAVPEASPSPASAAISMEGLLSPAERTELLAGVRAFLVDQGLRLTAMTLAEVRVRGAAGSNGAQKYCSTGPKHVPAFVTPSLPIPTPIYLLPVRRSVTPQAGQQHQQQRQPQPYH